MACINSDLTSGTQALCHGCLDYGLRFQRGLGQEVWRPIRDAAVLVDGQGLDQGSCARCSGPNKQDADEILKSTCLVLGSPPPKPVDEVITMRFDDHAPAAGSDQDEEIGQVRLESRMQMNLGLLK